MIVRPCPDSLDCPSDEPLDNFSSEADDSLDYISTQYGYLNPTNRLWNKTICGVTFVSDISQADADMQAKAAALSCNPCLGSDCGTTTGGGGICNNPQSPCVPCPDGTLSCFNVPGGMFCGFTTQAEADSAAYNFGLLQARKNAVCISPITQCTCVGQAFATQAVANTTVTWSMDGGSLPPGLTIPSFTTPALLIGGVPTFPGIYTFQIRADSPLGTYSIRRFSITVLAVTTLSIPPYTIGVPYSFQLQATGGSGSYQWKLSSGSLPNGLILSPSGLISGVPT